VRPLSTADAPRRPRKRPENEAEGASCVAQMQRRGRTGENTPVALQPVQTRGRARKTVSTTEVGTTRSLGSTSIKSVARVDVDEIGSSATCNRPAPANRTKGRHQNASISLANAEAALVGRVTHGTPCATIWTAAPARHPSRRLNARGSGSCPWLRGYSRRTFNSAGFPHGDAQIYARAMVERSSTPAHPWRTASRESRPATFRPSCRDRLEPTSQQHAAA
jgi:hypothetical protein